MVIENLFLAALFPVTAPPFPPLKLQKLKDLSELSLQEAPPEALVRVPWFPEKLQYNVKWGLVSLGTGYMQSNEVVRFNGRTAFLVRTAAVSNGFADKFYKVRDHYESFIDARTLASLGFAKQIREGDYFRDEWALYDYGDDRSFAKGRNKKGEETLYLGDIPGAVQDMLSSLYYIRTQDLKEGREFIIDVNTKKNWPLVVKVIKKERIKVPAGTFDCFLVEPRLRDEGLFIQKGNKLEVWLTDDERKMPVQMHVQVLFGHIRAELEGIGSP